MLHSQSNPGTNALNPGPTVAWLVVADDHLKSDQIALPVAGSSAIGACPLNSLSVCSQRDVPTEARRLKAEHGFVVVVARGRSVMAVLGAVATCADAIDAVVLQDPDHDRKRPQTALFSGLAVLSRFGWALAGLTVFGASKAAVGDVELANVRQAVLIVSTTPPRGARRMLLNAMQMQLGGLVETVIDGRPNPQMMGARMTAFAEAVARRQARITQRRSQARALTQGVAA